MRRSPEQYYKPPAPEDYRPYIKTDVSPALDSQRLSTKLLRGADRRDIPVATGGDFSLVLGYRKGLETPPKAGLVVSFEENDTDLSIIQMQGVRGKIGYRLTSGLEVPVFVARQVKEIAEAPESPYGRIVLPTQAQGVEDLGFGRAETTQGRYERIPGLLELRYSKAEKQYVRDLK